MVPLSLAADLPALDNNWLLSSQNDYNGDRKTDIFLHNAATGANTMWLMDGATVTATSNLPGLSQSWLVTTAGTHPLLINSILYMTSVLSSYQCGAKTLLSADQG
jgi:hypothetical protein